MLDTPKKIYNIDNTANKSGSITHFLNLKVQTKGETKDMQFLIVDIGNKDLLLGYPWLTTFEQGFKWRSTAIDIQALPMVISSTIPSPSKTIIATTLTDKTKHTIVQRQVEQSTIKGIATELAIKAGEGKKKVEIPKV